MSDPTTDSPHVPADAPAGIDFEHAELPEPAGEHVPCGVCRRSITTEYWQSLGKVLCDSCRERVARTATDARGGAAFGKAFLMGGAVALGCGIGYAVFVGFTSIQFALVTIGIGWAVGRSIQKATRGFGSTRHQVLAVALTYFASTMGYLPFIFKGFRNSAAESRQAEAQTGGPAAPATDRPAPDTSPASDEPAGASARPGAGASTAEPDHGLAASLVLFAGLTTAFMLAAPFVELSTGFSGLLGLAIIFFGLRTAWRVSRGVEATITGPHRIRANAGS
jgi:hypothetical protein